ncbi:MAG TPA: CoA-binding protein [Phycisphaerae bacterium]|nr:CoA-binding protein [Phycisphaerae bacterium]
MPDKKKTVAVLGASADRGKFSNKSVRAHLSTGWEVYPVNPKGGEIEGLKVFASLRDVPVPLDRVTVYLPPPVGVKALPDIAAVNPGEVWLNPGAESAELVAESRRLGVEPILGCSIVDLGVSPGQFPDR